MNQRIITERSSELRAVARDKMKGKWPMIMIGSLIYFLIIVIPGQLLTGFFGNSTGSGFSVIYAIVVAGPLTYGYVYWLLKHYRSEITGPSDIFYGFEHFIKAFSIQIVMGFFIFLWSLLLVIPGIIAALRYSQAVLYLVENPTAGVFESIRASKQMMRGNIGKYFTLNLSFLGWAIVWAAVSVGIVLISNMFTPANMLDAYLYGNPLVELLSNLPGYLLLIPYMQMTFIVFYTKLTGEEDKRRINEEVNAIEADPYHVDGPIVDVNEEEIVSEGKEEKNNDLHNS